MPYTIETFPRPLNEWVDGDPEVFIGLEMTLECGRIGTIVGARTYLGGLHLFGEGFILELDVAYPEMENA